MKTKIDKVSESYKIIQASLCEQLEKNEPKARFSSDPWERKIGAGESRVLSGGKAIAKAAVNFSKVSGAYSAEMAKMAGSKAKTFRATGLSSIIHPVNPHSPIIHFNIRYFELDDGQCWFGGGMDLTPHYVDVAEAKWFHARLKEICDTYSPDFYPEFKDKADQYFFLSHRNETRGVGGIFFDMQRPGESLQFDHLLRFTIDLGKQYATMYNQLLEKTSRLDYGSDEVKWQNVRRGRYVEFNLIHDRGTKFGLLSNGNTESILVSLPPDASWEYNFMPEEGSREEKSLNMLKKGIDWVNL